MVNSGLMDFEHCEILRWHLSVIIDFKEVVDNGMPSQEERDIVDPFCDQLDEEIKAGGNALFLVRETWNKTRRLVWMVYDAEIAHQHLQYIIDQHRHPRPFDYRMEVDSEWKQPEFYFRAIRDNQSHKASATADVVRRLNSRLRDLERTRKQIQAQTRSF
jgi:hypothetical protein